MFTCAYLMLIMTDLFILCCSFFLSNNSIGKVRLVRYMNLTQFVQRKVYFFPHPLCFCIPPFLVFHEVFSYILC